MKIKKLLLVLLLSIVIGIFNIPVESKASYNPNVPEYYSGNIKYKINEETNEAIVTGTKNKNVKKIVIPSKIDEYKVTEIGYYAFGDYKNLTDVTIPNTVKKINGEAFFNCKKIKNIKIPNSVQLIGYYAFFGCSGLEKIEIPNSVTTIENMAFESCSNLKSVKLSENLKAIDGYAFYGCKKLTSVKVPKKVKVIGDGAFENCKKLKQVKIPSSVKKIGVDVFNKCNTNLVLIVENKSYAKKYAKDNKINYESNITKNLKISWVKAGKKQAKIKWNKISGVTGYEIYMSSSKNGKYSKIKTIKNAKTITYTKTNLKKNKKYYFKVRAYKVINGQKIYGDFSKVQKVITK